MIVKLQGGLGNQLFIAAYGMTEAKKRNEELFFDVSLLGIGEPKRSLEVDAFIDVKIKNDPQAEEGYWQSEKYFDSSLIRKIFIRPRILIPREIYEIGLEIQGLGFIGVRRADYLLPERLNYHGILLVEYYKEAIFLFPKETKFVCFSDDPKWAEDALGLPAIRTSSAWDIWLMSLCNHAIIANSTFHWWGAWLGADLRGKVVAPKKWLVNQDWPIVPERWISI